jgi:hypothetical protein
MHHLTPMMEILMIAPLQMVVSRMLSPMFFARSTIRSEALVVEAGSILLSVHVIGSERSLVGFGKSTIPLNFAQSVFCLQRQGRDQVHGSCWWKNTNRIKTLFILTLDTLTMIRYCIHCLFYGWQDQKDEHGCSIQTLLIKRVELLNQWKDCQSVSNFLGLRQSSPKVTTFSSFNYAYDI